MKLERDSEWVDFWGGGRNSRLPSQKESPMVLGQQPNVVNPPPISSNRLHYVPSSVRNVKAAAEFGCRSWRLAKSPGNVARMAPTLAKSPANVTRNLAVVAKSPPIVARKDATLAKSPQNVARISATLAKSQENVARLSATLAKPTENVARNLAVLAKSPPNVAKNLVTLAKSRENVARIQATLARSPASESGLDLILANPVWIVSGWRPFGSIPSAFVPGFSRAGMPGNRSVTVAAGLSGGQQKWSPAQERLAEKNLGETPGRAPGLAAEFGSQMGSKSSAHRGAGPVRPSRNQHERKQHHGLL